ARDRLVVTARAQLEQQAILTAAAFAIAIDRRGRAIGAVLLGLGGASRLRGGKRSRARQQADQGVVQQFHLHALLHDPHPHFRTPPGAVGSSLASTRTLARTSGLRRLASAS